MLAEIKGLTKVYDTGNIQVSALQGVNLNIQQGEFVAIMGPSGSGKTTFMNLLGCLDRPTSGHYTLDGKRVEELNDDQLAAIRNRYIGFVFQQYNLLQRQTALQNVELPLMYAHNPNRRERAMDALEKLGIADRAHHTPMEMSGGQQQRVAIARALAGNPSLILADEPTGNLDSKTGEEVMDLFCALNEQGITLMMVTHDAKVAGYANRLVQFLDGQILSDEANGAVHGGDKQE